MKKSFLATAVKAATLLTLTALSSTAFADPKIYGQIRLNTELVDTETKENGVVTEKSDRPTMNSRNSRIGFTGTEKISDKVELEYKLEYKIDIAESTDSNFSARHGYLALKHEDYGRLLAGRTITNDDNIITGNAWLWGTGIGPFSGHETAWASNGFLYTTPKFNNGTTTAFIQYGMDEGKAEIKDGKLVDNKGSRTFTTFKNGELTDISRDFVIIGAQYDGDKTTGGVAYTRAGDDLNALLVAADYQINDQWSVNGTAQYTDFNSNDNELALFGGVAYKVKDPVLAWVEASYTDNYKGYGNGEAVGVNVGASYDFSKTFKAFANVGFLKEEFNDTEIDSKGIELGAVYRF
ncbi:porin [Moraxella canis]|uniref:Porin n=1 Tax=Moraxella canis TaxID=90239 RepID=A0ABZ0WVI6_9GAMM|nr:porin [Moraxella canis]WQE03249.1 porin [Moraxella canis]